MQEHDTEPIKAPSRTAIAVGAGGAAAAVAADQQQGYRQLSQQLQRLLVM
jgi:shikimate 5-dehydrogenase